MDDFKEQLKTNQETKQAADINLLSMIESRIMEIIHIENECKTKLPKLYNQRLPRFMRRRAACHDLKRIPKKLRLGVKTNYGSKDRKTLLKFKRRVKFRKHKRSLKKHACNKFKDPNKCLLHKWFAKRFKMNTIEHTPMYNSTKNQRNLYRQTLYGCAYISMAHLLPVYLDINSLKSSNDYTSAFDKLNELTNPISGFTFSAMALKQGKYEVCVHLYLPSFSSQNCKLSTCLVSLNEQIDEKHKTRVTIWVQRVDYQQVYKCLKEMMYSSELSEIPQVVSVKKVHPRELTRIRLVGPDSREEALKLADDKKKHQAARDDVDLRLIFADGVTIGRQLEEKNASYVYYKTNPNIVDITFKSKEGRMLWYKLIKNKAHLAGGHRDLERLLTKEYFKLKPDCSR